MKLYLRLLKFVKPHGWIFFLALLCMMVSTLFNGVSLGMLIPLSDRILTDQEIIVGTDLPVFLDNFIQIINSMESIKLLNIIAIGILVLVFLKGIFLFIQNVLMNDISQRVMRDIRDEIYKKFQMLSLSYFSENKSGMLVSRITYDVMVIKDAISQGLSDLLYQSFQVILFLFIIFFVHSRLAFISIVLFPLIVIPIVKIGRALRKFSASAQENMGQLNSTIYESISGVRIVKAFSMEDYEIGKFKKYNSQLYKIAMKLTKRMHALSPITEFLGAIGAAGVLFIGGREVICGRLSSGIFIFFLGALLSLIKPINRLCRVHGTNQRALAAADRIFEILDTKSKVIESPTPKILKCVKKNIELEKVWFGYNSKFVLKDINLNIKVGQVVAIVGPTGVGKTTLVNLIPRFYDPSRGKVKIDGEDIRKFSLKSLREKIGMVTQETILFNDTVKTNIKYGSLEASESEIIKAAQIANAHQFITNLPLGYETVVGDRGFKLSGGEKQRLAIARTILKNPSILILDEATSQLDTQSEILIQQALDQLIQNRTVIAIAHRLSTIMRADKIVVLDKGKIIEVGKHKDLIENGGLYKKLYELQFIIEEKL